METYENLNRRIIKNKPACYVLITCDQPTEDGKMNVDMTYEGDEDMAAFLIHSAQNCLEDQYSSQISLIK